MRVDPEKKEFKCHWSEAGLRRGRNQRFSCTRGLRSALRGGYTSINITPQCYSHTPHWGKQESS